MRVVHVHRNENARYARFLVTPPRSLRSHGETPPTPPARPRTYSATWREKEELRARAAPTGAAINALMDDLYDSFGVSRYDGAEDVWSAKEAKPVEGTDRTVEDET